MYRLVPGNVWLAEDIHVSVKCFIFLYRCDCFAFWVQNGSDSSRTVILFYVRGDADIVVSAFHKDRRRPASLLHDLVNKIEIIIHLCRTKIDDRHLLTSHHISPFGLWRTQFVSL